MNKILNFVDKWTDLTCDVIFVGIGVLFCKFGIDHFYSDTEKYSRK